MNVVFPDPAIPRHMIQVGLLIVCSPLALEGSSDACSLVLGTFVMSIRCAISNTVIYRCRRIMCPQEYVSKGHIGLGYCPTGQIRLGICVWLDRKSCLSLGKCVRPSPWPEISF